MKSVANPSRIHPKIWRRLRIAAQIISFLFFLFIFIAIPQNNIETRLLSLPIRLSPLAMFGSSLAARVLLPGMALAVIFLLVGVVFGRAWCGWLCPLGSVIELFPIRRKRTLRVSENWRKGKYLILTALVTAAALGSLSLLVFDPLTIFYRTFTFVIWPALSFAIQTLEIFLYRITFLQSFLDWFDGILRPTIFPVSQFVFSQALLFFGIFLTIILLNYFAERFWCRYLCPMGGLLGWISRISFLKREVTADCISCGKCAQVCQTGTVDEKSGYASDPAECTVCMDCGAACPNGSNRFAWNFHPAPNKVYDPSRREALVTIGAATAGLAVVSAQPPSQADLTRLIRPPGVMEEIFLSQCTRCGDCYRICPTNALQPSLFEGGISGFWTPFLVPRIGYCSFSCNACGKICPVQAIPPLALEDKRLVKIGSAYIDQNLCIAWADDRDCIVCEEMCPLPHKAITLRQRDSVGQPSSVLVPVVDRGLCIGCGICENKCPVVGQAAIQVRIPQNS